MFCSINWIEGARKIAVSTNTKYSATTYVKDIDCDLSITIEIRDDINRGYLTFLQAELVKRISFINMSFNVMEGRKCVAILYILRA